MTKVNLVDERRLVTASSFAQQKGVQRTYVYRLIDQDKIDWCEIGGILFVVLTEKTLAYQPKTFKIELYNNGETNG